MKALGALRKRFGGVVKVLGTLAVAGAALSVAAPAAKAQVAFGVEVGSGPRYYEAAPAYGGAAYGYGYNPHAYWEHRRYEEWRAQQWREHASREHEYWRERRDYDRDRRYDGYGWR
ncbi:MAG: hypothetical protein INR62_13235 [Rhodospirillales bacterium]|nr:hypothetical protein [Acetobacter sp.]